MLILWFQVSRAVGCLLILQEICLTLRMMIAVEVKDQNIEITAVLNRYKYFFLFRTLVWSCVDYCFIVYIVFANKTTVLGLKN